MATFGNLPLASCRGRSPRSRSPRRRDRRSRSRSDSRRRHSYRDRSDSRGGRDREEGRRRDVAVPVKPVVKGRGAVAFGARHALRADDEREPRYEILLFVYRQLWLVFHMLACVGMRSSAPPRQAPRQARRASPFNARVCRCHTDNIYHDAR
jgi:hypothetical protein